MQLYKLDICLDNVGNANLLKQGKEQEKKENYWKERGLKANTKICKSVQLSKDVHQKVRIFAALNDESISSVIEKSINYYIKNKG